MRILVALISTLLLSTLSFADNTDILTSQVEKGSYWTREKLLNARPLPLPKLKLATVDDPISVNPEEKISANAKPPLHPLKHPRHIESALISHPFAFTTLPADHGTLNEYFSSSRIVPNSSDVDYPYSTVGALFFTIPNVGEFRCSAAVIAPRLIITAGHCLHSGSNGAAGFYTNFLFFPSYRNGDSIYGSWTTTFVAVPNTWATSGGNVPNAADFGLLETQDRIVNETSIKIGDITGFLGFQLHSLKPNHVHMIGYACNFDNCEVMHQVTAQSARAVTEHNVEYGSDMLSGSDGSPWIQNFGVHGIGDATGINPANNKVVGVTSFIYPTPDEKAQGASYFDNRFLTLWNKMCRHQVNNCLPAVRE